MPQLVAQLPLVAALRGVEVHQRPQGDVGRPLRGGQGADAEVHLAAAEREDPAVARTAARPARRAAPGARRSTRRRGRCRDSSGRPPRTRCRGARSGRAAGRAGSGRRRRRPAAGSAPSRGCPADLEDHAGRPGRRRGRRRRPGRRPAASRRRPAPRSRIWSSSSVRGTAEPWSGSEPPGQGSSRPEPKPCARSPRLTTCDRVHVAEPQPVELGHRPRGQPVAAGLVPGEGRRVGQQSPGDPSRAAQAAADAPAGPAPTTRTSVSASVEPGHPPSPTERDCSTGRRRRRGFRTEIVA